MKKKRGNLRFSWRSLRTSYLPIGANNAPGLIRASPLLLLSLNYYALPYAQLSKFIIGAAGEKATKVVFTSASSENYHSFKAHLSIPMARRLRRHKVAKSRYSSERCGRLQAVGCPPPPADLGPDLSTDDLP